MDGEYEEWEKNLSVENGIRIDCVEYSQNHGVQEACREFGVARSTVYHWLRHEKAIKNNTFGNRKKRGSSHIAQRLEETLSRMKVLEDEVSGLKSIFRDKLGV